MNICPSHLPETAKAKAHRYSDLFPTSRLLGLVLACAAVLAVGNGAGRQGQDSPPLPWGERTRAKGDPDQRGASQPQVPRLLQASKSSSMTGQQRGQAMAPLLTACYCICSHHLKLSGGGDRERAQLGSPEVPRREWGGERALSLSVSTVSRPGRSRRTETPAAPLGLCPRCRHTVLGESPRVTVGIPGPSLTCAPHCRVGQML